MTRIQRTVLSGILLAALEHHVQGQFAVQALALAKLEELAQAYRCDACGASLDRAERRH